MIGKLFCILVASVLPAIVVSQTVDSVKMTLERQSTGFGRIPEYRVTIDQAGYVLFQPISYCASKDDKYYTVPKSVVDTLVRHFLNLGYFSLRDSYYSSSYESAPGDTSHFVGIMTVSDQHTAVTSLRIGSRTKSVVNYYGAPDALTKLECEIDSLLNTSKFTRR